jgi:hypothetical protein
MMPDDRYERSAATPSAAYAERAVRRLYLVGASILRACDEPERTAGRFYRDATSRFIRIVDELIEPYARFWAHTEITVVVEP